MKGFTSFSTRQIGAGFTLEDVSTEFGYRSLRVGIERTKVSGIQF